jgi:hypothetical protein
MEPLEELAAAGAAQAQYAAAAAAQQQQQQQQQYQQYMLRLMQTQPQYALQVRRLGGEGCGAKRAGG